jgi:twinfilin-like protein
LLDALEPCYVLFRLDAPTASSDESTSSSAADWVLMCYVPDKAKVRDKMLYSSTRAALRKELGGGTRIADEMWGTNHVRFAFLGGFSFFFCFGPTNC